MRIESVAKWRIDLTGWYLALDAPEPFVQLRKGTVRPGRNFTTYQ